MNTTPYNLRKNPKPSNKKLASESMQSNLGEISELNSPLPIDHPDTSLAGILAESPSVEQTPRAPTPLDNTDNLYTHPTDREATEDAVEPMTHTTAFTDPPAPFPNNTMLIQDNISDANPTPNVIKSIEPEQNVLASITQLLHRMTENINEKIEVMKLDMTENFNDKIGEIKLDVQLSQNALENKISESNTRIDKLQNTLTQQIVTLKIEIEDKIKINHATIESKLTCAVNEFQTRTDNLEERQEKMEIDFSKQMSSNNQELKQHVADTLSIIKKDVDYELNQFNSEQKQKLIILESSLKDETKSLVLITKTELEDQQNKKLNDTLSQFNQLKDQMMQQESTRTNIHVTCTGGNPDVPLQNLPKFNGRQSNPNLFLERLHACYTRCAARRNIKLDTDIDLLSEIVENCLESHSARWWQLIKKEVSSWKEFEEAFLFKYWSRDVQRGIRQRLEIEKYRPNGPLSRAEYFIERVIILQSMCPTPTDDEIISILVEHYDDVIRNARRVQNIESLREFEALLQREDMLERNNSLRYSNNPRPFNRSSPQLTQDYHRRPPNVNHNTPRDAPRHSNQQQHNPPFSTNTQYYQRNNPQQPIFDRRQPPPNYQQRQPTTPPQNNHRNTSYPTPEQKEVYHTIAKQHTPPPVSQDPKDTPSTTNPNNHSPDGYLN